MKSFNSNVNLLGFDQRILDITEELQKLKVIGEENTPRYQTLVEEIITLQEKLDLLYETWPKNFPKYYRD